MTVGSSFSSTKSVTMSQTMKPKSSATPTAAKAASTPAKDSASKASATASPALAHRNTIANPSGGDKLKVTAQNKEDSIDLMTGDGGDAAFTVSAQNFNRRHTVAPTHEIEKINEDGREDDENEDGEEKKLQDSRATLQQSPS